MLGCLILKISAGNRDITIAVSHDQVVETVPVRLEFCQERELALFGKRETEF